MEQCVFWSLTVRVLWVRTAHRGGQQRTAPFRIRSSVTAVTFLLSVFSSSPPNCHIAVKMCAWPMVMNGQSMQWAPKLTSLSWIRGSHHTTSSLSAPGSEAAVRARCAPQAYSCIAIGFCPSVSILVSRRVRWSLWRCVVTQRGAGMPAWQPSFKHFRQMCGHKSLWWKPIVRILVVSVFPHITLLSFLC